MGFTKDQLVGGGARQVAIFAGRQVTQGPLEAKDIQCRLGIAKIVVSIDRGGVIPARLGRVSRNPLASEVERNRRLSVVGQADRALVQTLFRLRAGSDTRLDGALEGVDRLFLLALREQRFADERRGMPVA